MNAKTVNSWILAIGCSIIFVSFLYTTEPQKSILLSIGTSIVASAVVMIATALLEKKFKKILYIIKFWKLENIFETRGIMNQTCDKCIDEAKSKIDAIGFGFRSWRSTNQNKIIDLLKKGVHIRILSPNPDSEFIKQRELDENEQPGTIKYSIEELKSWVNDLKQYGSIEVQFYNWLPMDFYFRVDNDIFIGPYLYKKQSQSTVSFQYKKGGKMFDDYEELFEKSWEEAKKK